MRIAMGIEYDGSRFRGWQSQQPGVRTIQDCLEKALTRVADHPVHIACAGRTDAGVHASAQVIHFDTQARRPPHAWIMGSNSNLPDDIGVCWASPVADEFHARFSALSRRYRYLILNRPYRSPLYRQRAAWHYRPLAEKIMAEAGATLLGEHDFTSFRAAGCQAHSPVRKLHALTVERQGDFILLEVEANGFLHRMVRNIVGVLMAIGSGDHPVSWVREVLMARDRTQGGITAPAQGLYLVRVRYPMVFQLPSTDAFVGEGHRLP